jgi:hypothetical protein
MNYNCLTVESMNAQLTKNLRALMSPDERYDVDHVMLSLGFALGLVPEGVPNWKAVVRCPAISEVLYAVLELLVRLGVLLRYTKEHDDLYWLPPLDQMYARPITACREYKAIPLWHTSQLTVSVERDGLFLRQKGAPGRKHRAESVVEQMKGKKHES